MNWEDNWTKVNTNAKKGGQGEVTKVVSKIDPNVFGALKLMHSDQKGDSARRRRQLTEIESLKKLDGEGVPKLLESYTSDAPNKTPYFIMEWINGLDLDEYIQSYSFTIKNALEFTRKLALIVDKCHQNGIIHRDIKPQNIRIIQKSSNPILVDFGISWNEHESVPKNQRTAIGEEIGNRFLRLPEHASGSNQKRDKISDTTFLVGILFYLITKVTPRILKDEDNQMPNERQLPENIQKVLSTDPLWSKVKRIFNVGFQYSINLRFRSCISLIEYIDNCMETNDSEPLDPTKTLSETQKLLSELFNTEELEEQRKVKAQFENLNYRIHSEIQEMLRSKGFSVGAGHTGLINSHTIHINIRNATYSDLTVKLLHHIKIEENRLIAGYSIDAIKPGNPNKIAIPIPIVGLTNYYDGYISDFDSLKEGINNYKAIFINEAIKGYLSLTGQ
jgi:serine/threonine-protein kinase